MLGMVGKRYKLKEPLKRYWQTALWSRFFDILMNPGKVSEGGKGMDEKKAVWRELGIVRVEMEEWLVAIGERKGRGGGWNSLAERGRGRAGKQ